MRISDWSSDVCSSDLCRCGKVGEAQPFQESGLSCILYGQDVFHTLLLTVHENAIGPFADRLCEGVTQSVANRGNVQGASVSRSEEHTSELQSLMRNSYAVFCLKKKLTNLYNRRLLRQL